ncbi:MAG: antitoxin [Thermoplasmatales archaeon]|nr:antitoxin [Thermoplasmatales archaeon]
MTVCTVRVTNEEKEAIRNYAEANGISMGEALKNAFFEMLEDEYDIKNADEAYKIFLNDGVAIPHSEMMKKHGL